MMMMKKILLEQLSSVLLVLLFIVNINKNLQLIYGYKTSGEIDQINSWQYVDRFVYSENGAKLEVFDYANYTDKASYDGVYGKIGFDIEYYSYLEKPKLAVYVGFEMWETIYESRLTCQEKLDKADKIVELTKIAEHIPQSNPWTTDKISSGTLYVELYESTFVFVVLANCLEECDTYCQGPLRVNYALHFENAINEKASEVSSEDRHFVVIFWVYLVLQTLMVIYCRNISISLKEIERYHHTVKMLVASVWLAYLGSICYQIHFMASMKDGIGQPFFKILGGILMQLSELVFLLMVMVVSMGWTIVRRKLSFSARLRITIFFTFLCITFLCLEIWRNLDFDTGKFINYYASLIGTVKIMAHFTTLLWFWLETLKTLRKFTNKKAFYESFMAIGCCWLFFRPFMIIISFTVNPISRKFFLICWDLILMVLPQILCMFLYDPIANFNKSFPFHANDKAMFVSKKNGNKRGIVGVYSDYVKYANAPVAYDEVQNGTSSSNETDNNEKKNNNKEIINSTNNSKALQVSAGPKLVTDQEIEEFYDGIKEMGNLLSQIVTDITIPVDAMVNALSDWRGDDEDDEDL